MRLFAIFAVILVLFIILIIVQVEAQRSRRRSLRRRRRTTTRHPPLATSVIDETLKFVESTLQNLFSLELIVEVDN